MVDLASLPRRTWTPDERRTVARGFSGRLLIAVEPLICSIIFFVLMIAPFCLAQNANNPMIRPDGARFSLAAVLAPIMGFGALSFGIYAAALLIKPARALISTHAPIYIIDGYLRYATTSRGKGQRHTVVEILTHDGACLRDWHMHSLLAVTDGTYPALVEFSRYGGILRIDGKPVEPPLFPLRPFGIGSFSEHIVATPGNIAKPR